MILNTVLFFASYQVVYWFSATAKAIYRHIEEYRMDPMIPSAPVVVQPGSNMYIVTIGVIVMMLLGLDIYHIAYYSLLIFQTLKHNEYTYQLPELLEFSMYIIAPSLLLWCM